MNHDVFISYSSVNINTALAICHELEHNNIRCWMAPRNIQASSNYADCIDDAIIGCKVFLIIFSETSQLSKWVKGELNVAFDSNKPIIPFRIDNTSLKGAMRLILNDKHWLDAYPNPEASFETLVTTVMDIINGHGNTVNQDIIKGDPMPVKYSAGIFSRVINKLTERRAVKILSNRPIDIYINGDSKGIVAEDISKIFHIKGDSYLVEIFSNEYGKKVKCRYEGNFNGSSVYLNIDMATKEKEYLLNSKNPDTSDINDLGIIFLDENRFDDAKDCFLKAANRGEAASAYNLGMMYHYGKGVDVDYDVCIEFYERAAIDEYPLALNNLGSLYYNGEYVKKDLQKAFGLFLRAAERGLENAQYTVATMLFYGQGVEIDKVKAKKWFEITAKNGSSAAQQYLDSWVD